MPETASAVGGEKSAVIIPPIRKPTPVIADAIDSSRPVSRACRSCGVDSCSAVITDTHWIPLPSPPSTEKPQASPRSLDTAMPR